MRFQNWFELDHSNVFRNEDNIKFQTRLTALDFNILNPSKELDLRGSNSNSKPHTFGIQESNGTGCAWWLMDAVMVADF